SWGRVVVRPHPSPARSPPPPRGGGGNGMRPPAQRSPGSGAGWRQTFGAKRPPSRFRGYSLTSFSTTNSGARPLPRKRDADSVRSPPPCGEGLGVGVRVGGRVSCNNDDPPPTRGEGAHRVWSVAGRGPTSPSGKRSRSDTPGRGVARISLRV